MTKQTINLSQIEKLREVNRSNRLFQRTEKVAPKISITGTFPVAKQWNAEQLKKEVVEGGLKVENAIVEDVRVKWIVANLDGTTVYLKLTEDAKGSIVMEK